MTRHRRPIRPLTVALGVLGAAGVATVLASIVGDRIVPDPQWRTALLVFGAALFYTAKWLLDQDGAEDRATVLGDRIVKALETAAAGLKQMDQSRELAMGQELQQLLAVARAVLAEVDSRHAAPPAATPEPEPPVTAPLACVTPAEEAAERRWPERITEPPAEVGLRRRGDTGVLFDAGAVSDPLHPDWTYTSDPAGRAS
jgi:hypothetical protein